LLILYCIKNAVVASVLLATLCLAFGITQTVAEEIKPIEMGCNTFPPLKIDDLTGEAPGIHVEILQAAFAEAGLDFKYSFFPWKRAYSMAAKGRLDGLCSCSYRQDREPFFWFSEEIDSTSVGIITLKRNEKAFKSLAELHHLEVGVVRGYNLENELKEEGITYFSANNENQLLAMLVERRIDAIFSFEKPIRYYARAIKSRPKLAFSIFRVSPVYVCFSKKRQRSFEVMARFNQALRGIKRSGKIEEIINKYQ